MKTINPFKLGTRMLGGALPLAFLLSAGVLIQTAAAQTEFRTAAWFQAPRDPVDAAIHHLQSIYRRDGVYSAHERTRYDHALRHLSEFQEARYRGRFDKDKLDDAISDVQHVVDRNPMDEHARDTLWKDLANLRGYRANYGHTY